MSFIQIQLEIPQNRILEILDDVGGNNEILDSNVKKLVINCILLLLF